MAGQCRGPVSPKAQRSQYTYGLVSWIDPTHNNPGLASSSEVIGARSKGQVMNMKRSTIADGEIRTYTWLG